MHDGHGEKVFDLFFRTLTPRRRASIGVVIDRDRGAIDRRMRVPHSTSRRSAASHPSASSRDENACGAVTRSAPSTGSRYDA